MRRVVLLLVLLAFVGGASAWLSGYDHRMPISVNNTGDNLTYYQYNFTGNTATLVSAGKMDANGSDCRITNATDVLQPFWNKTAFNESDTKIWVNATSLGNVTNTTHYFYYGNAGATFNGSISNTAYVLGDDFSVSGLATWAKNTSNPLASLTQTWASVWKNSSEYRMYYSVAGDLSYVGWKNSSDGITWADQGNCMNSGGGADWDNNIWCPMVWEEDGAWHMIYAGEMGNALQVGHATSTTGVGGSWTKDPNNPVFNCPNDWAHNDTEPWGIMKDSGTYYMVFNTLLYLNTSSREACIAKSTNLSTGWAPVQSTSMWTGGRFCGFNFKKDNYYYVLLPHYTSGTDYVQIELWRDASPNMTNSVKIKDAIKYSASGWDSIDQDTPCVLTDDINRSTFVNDELWTYFAGYNASGWNTGVSIETDIDDALLPIVNPDRFIPHNTYSVENSQLKLEGGTKIAWAKSTKNITLPYIIEFDAKLNERYLYLAWRWSGLYFDPPDTPDNCTWDQFDTYNSYLYKTVAGSPSAIQSVAFTQSYNVMRHYMIVDNSTNIKTYVNGTKYNDASDSYSGGNKIGFGTRTSNIVYYDNIFVRKYADPEPIASLGAEENAPDTNEIVLYANEYALINNHTTDQTYQQVDNNITNAVCFSYYNSTSGLWEAYRAGYTYNHDAIIPKNCSVFVFVDAQTTVSATVNSGGVTIQNATWFYGMLPGSTSKTITQIIAAMNADGLDVWSFFAFTNSTQAYTNTGSYSVAPNEGYAVYVNTTGEYTP